MMAGRLLFCLTVVLAVLSLLLSPTLARRRRKTHTHTHHRHTHTHTHRHTKTKTTSPPPLDCGINNGTGVDFDAIREALSTGFSEFLDGLMETVEVCAELFCDPLFLDVPGCLACYSGAFPLIPDLVLPP